MVYLCSNAGRVVDVLIVIVSFLFFFNIKMQNVSWDVAATIILKRREIIVPLISEWKPKREGMLSR